METETERIDKDGTNGASAPSQVPITCENCIFFTRNQMTQGDNGFCYRNPPHPFPIPAEDGKVQFIGVYPPVRMQNWCGEFEQADTILRAT